MDPHENRKRHGKTNHTMKLKSEKEAPIETEQSQEDSEGSFIATAVTGLFSFFGGGQPKKQTRNFEQKE